MEDAGAPPSTAAPPPSPRGVSLLGIAFLVTLTVTGWTMISLVLTPLFMLALIPVSSVTQIIHPVYRRITHMVQWTWMANVAILLEYAYGIHVEVSGDEATKANEAALTGERALWLANHRTRIDWMLLWSLALRTQTLDRLKIILKAPLRKAPIFGWAMQHFLFIFLNRRWADDQGMLDDYLPFLASKEPGASYMLFPEGTDLSESNLEKSAAYAQKEGVEERMYSLYPRTTGFTYLLPKLRDGLDAVYDLTMFFVDHTPNERPSEAHLLSARMPRVLHVHIERIDIKNLALDEAELVAWLKARFTRKEAHLKAFYEENGRLPDGAQPLFTDSITPTATKLLAFWLLFLTAAFQCARACGLVGICYGVVVFVGYLVATQFLGGIDGILRKTL